MILTNQFKPWDYSCVPIQYYTRPVQSIDYVLMNVVQLVYQQSTLQSYSQRK